ncbi:hypothetical protein DAI22_03g240900 [Oryza sativa Japonica Group]|nr:hypothetical protein DAI22_03g240900 [Oryza sativa Japonica Group]
MCGSLIGARRVRKRPPTRGSHVSGTTAWMRRCSPTSPTTPTTDTACGPNLAARNWLGFTGAIPSFLTVYVCKINSKYLSGLSSNKKMVGKETTGQIALDDITPMDMALKLDIYVNM